MSEDQYSSEVKLQFYLRLVDALNFCTLKPLCLGSVVFLIIFLYLLHVLSKNEVFGYPKSHFLESMCPVIDLPGIYVNFMYTHFIVMIAEGR